MLTTIRITHEVNSFELAALLWDAVMDEADDEDEGYKILISRELTAPKVKAMVRRRLELYGSRSVECGPRNEWPSEYVEGAARCRVVNVYGAR